MRDFQYGFCNDDVILIRVASLDPGSRQVAEKFGLLPEVVEGNNTKHNDGAKVLCKRMQ